MGPGKGKGLCLVRGNGKGFGICRSKAIGEKGFFFLFSCRLVVHSAWELWDFECYFQMIRGRVSNLGRRGDVQGGKFGGHGGGDCWNCDSLILILCIMFIVYISSSAALAPLAPLSACRLVMQLTCPFDERMIPAKQQSSPPSNTRCEGPEDSTYYGTEQ